MQAFEENYKRLNKFQKQAVDTTEGPVMVIAGPGTGKTQILSLRIANILKKGNDISPENILCITFTEAGAKAMRERLQRFIGSDAYQININTFHGFANEVIQSNPEKFEFTKSVKQLDDLNRIKIFRKIIDETEDLKSLKPFYDKYAKIRDITSALQILKKEGITPSEFEEKLTLLIQNKEDNPQMRGEKPTKKWQKELDKLIDLKELVVVYKKYQEILKDEDLYDYEDMIVFVIEKFEEDDDFTNDFREKYQYIHVDEFQDTNGAQNRIVNLLSKPSRIDEEPNIFVVGDDDQAIYRFQGANISNIIRLSDRFPNIEKIVTPVNYRSTQIILDIADSLIANNRMRLVESDENLEKNLISFKSKTSNQLGDKAEVFNFENEDSENIFIANKILDLKENGVNYNDISIIYRKNYHSESINETLRKFEIPTKLDTSKSVFESEGVKQLIELMFCVNLFDKFLDERLYDVLQFDFFNFKTVDVWKLAKSAYSDRVTLFEKMAEHYEENKHSDISKYYENLINWHKSSRNMKLSKFLEILLNESGILSFYQNTESEVEKNSENTFNDILAINSLYKYILQQEELNPNLKLNQFLKDLDLITENKIKISLPKIETNKDAVNLLTAHGSKGLEFDYVFITKCTENNWGKARKTRSLIPEEIYSFDLEEISDKELSIEDERRLFFVAITRAREKIFFTYANEYSYLGNTTTPSVTQFLSEIDNNLVNEAQTNEDSAAKVDDVVKTMSPAKNLDFNSYKKEFLEDQISKFKLSASALNTYIDSPERFKNEYLIRIPKIKTKYMALGTAVHSSLELMNRNIKNQNTLPELENLIQNFNFILKKEFYGDEEFESVKLEGEKLIREYFAENKELIKNSKPIEIEYNFGFHSVFYDPKKDGFDTEIIPLTGRIDKLELINEENNLVRVVDYKTGGHKTKNQILGLTKNADKSLWRQLVFYKLLGECDSKFRLNQNLNKPKYLIEEAQLDFIKKHNGKFRKENFEIKSNDLLELKEVVVDVVKRIRNLEFPKESAIN